MIQKLDEELKKEKVKQAGSSSDEPRKPPPQKSQEAEVDNEETGGGRPQEKKVPGDYPSARKLCFSTNVTYVEQMTYNRICIMVISCVSNFYQRQTLDMKDFTMETVSWMEKRKHTGLSEDLWKNLFVVLQRNMKKCFTKDDLYLYPLLNRKSNIVGAVGSASLMATDLSYLMNGGAFEDGFKRLCDVCVMACKADIPENAVHCIHQFILNSLRRDLFLSNKTNFTADLWSFVKFGDKESKLYKAFQKGKPVSADDEEDAHHREQGRGFGEEEEEGGDFE